MWHYKNLWTGPCGNIIYGTSIPMWSRVPGRIYTKGVLTKESDALMHQVNDFACDRMLDTDLYTDCAYILDS